MSSNQPKKEISLPPEIKLIPYVLVGFSFSQVLGILATGFGVYQVYILLVVLIMILLVPGALTSAGVQSRISQQLPKFQRASFYIPSMLAIAILIIGFVIGFWVGI